MLTLYDQSKAIACHHLDTDDGHTLYFEEYGALDGIPVIFLHGGPGGGCEPAHARFFDPYIYRVILLDQRGSGKSKPHASLENNTTDHLVKDIEFVREYLKIGRWLVFGGSWGSTLALVYAQRHKEKVLGMILRGIFLCRDEDIQWFYQKGCHAFFPDYWQDFLEPVAVEDRVDLLNAYHQLLTSENEISRLNAAKAWSLWEARTSTLLPNEELREHFVNPHFALAFARIESHYFVNKAFIAETPILDGMHKIEDIPATIIHGRYDVVCPVDQAYQLKQKWPKSELHITKATGHSAFEPANIDALVHATRRFAEQQR